MEGRWWWRGWGRGRVWAGRRRGLRLRVSPGWASSAARTTILIHTRRTLRPSTSPCTGPRTPICITCHTKVKLTILLYSIFQHLLALVTNHLLVKNIWRLVSSMYFLSVSHSYQVNLKYSSGTAHLEYKWYLTFLIQQILSSY